MEAAILALLGTAKDLKVFESVLVAIWQPCCSECNHMFIPVSSTLTMLQRGSEKKGNLKAQKGLVSMSRLLVCLQTRPERYLH